MAHEHDELNARRRQRQLHRQQAAQRRSRLRLLAALAAVALCLVGIGVLLLQRGTSGGDTTAGTTMPSQPPATTQPLPTEPQTVITITAAGDLNITDRVVAAGQQEGRYDYTHCFMDVAHILSQSDATVLNFEGNACGGPYGSATSSAPRELLEALKGAGVDFVQMANSCTVNNGLTGLSSSLDALRSAGLEPLGAFASQEEYESTQGFTIRNIGGIRVAFVAFTKGVGSLGLPAGSQDRVNLLYKDYSSTYQEVDTHRIDTILRAAAAAKPDVTIALLHWGSEYNDQISGSQKNIVERMLANGVDAIIGTHPNYVQQITYDAETGQLVAYSLGDFFGDGEKSGTAYSVLLQMQITRDNSTGETKITGWDYVPVYIAEMQGRLQVLRIREAMELYENGHVSRVSQETYEAMKYALERIAARVTG